MVTDITFTDANELQPGNDVLNGHKSGTAVIKLVEMMKQILAD